MKDHVEKSTLVPMVFIPVKQGTFDQVFVGRGGAEYGNLIIVFFWYFTRRGKFPEGLMCPCILGFHVTSHV